METTPMNPWFSMWLHPRRTIRWIVETNPDRLVLLLAAVGGIVEALINASSDSKGENMSLQAILLTSLIGGPLMGVIGLSAGIQGFYRSKLTLIERALLLAVPFMLIHPSIVTDILGVAILVGLYLFRSRSGGGTPTPESGR